MPSYQAINNNALVKHMLEHQHTLYHTPNTSLKPNWDDVGATIAIFQKKRNLDLAIYCIAFHQDQKSMKAPLSRVSCFKVEANKFTGQYQ